MKFRGNVAVMKKVFLKALRGVDTPCSLDTLRMSKWQSPAIMCSRLSSYGLLDVGSSIAYDEGKQIITAFAGKHRAVKWCEENEGKILIAFVGSWVQLEMMVKPESKNKQLLVRFVQR